MPSLNALRRLQKRYNLIFSKKAELEDETRRRHGLEAQERIYEKDGNEIHELPERHGRHEMPDAHSGRSLKI